MNESQTDGPRAIEIKICGGEYWMRLQNSSLDRVFHASVYIICEIFFYPDFSPRNTTATRGKDNFNV